MVHYIVEFYDSDSNQVEKESGLVGKESYSMAVDKICDYYGEKNIISLTVCECEELMCDEDIKTLFNFE